MFLMCILTASFVTRSRLLTKLPEHTWGLSNTVEGDYNWTNTEFDALRNSSTYLENQASWYEQRDYLYRYVSVYCNILWCSVLLVGGMRVTNAHKRVKEAGHFP